MTGDPISLIDEFVKEEIRDASQLLSYLQRRVLERIIPTDLTAGSLPSRKIGRRRLYVRHQVEALLLSGTDSGGEKGE